MDLRPGLLRGQGVTLRLPAMSLPEAARNLLYAFHENGILILADEFRDWDISALTMIHPYEKCGTNPVRDASRTAVARLSVAPL